LTVGGVGRNEDQIGARLQLPKNYARRFVVRDRYRAPASPSIARLSLFDGARAFAALEYRSVRRIAQYEVKLSRLAACPVTTSQGALSLSQDPQRH
jgi:hypothetical protein